MTSITSWCLLLKIPIKSLNNSICSWVIERYGNFSNFVFLFQTLYSFLKKNFIIGYNLTRLLYLYIIFLKSHCLIACKFSYINAQAFIHKDNLHLLCTTYLQPLDTGLICTVSACKTWKKNSVYVTTGSISKAIFCCI